MKQIIWKYPLKVDSNVIVEMPAGATVLALQTQNEAPCIWAAVDPDAAKIKRRFVIYPTNVEMSEEDQRLHYIGTFQLQKGQFVAHVFSDRVEYPI